MRVRIEKKFKLVAAALAMAAVLCTAGISVANASAATYSFTKTTGDYSSLKLKAAPAVIADIVDSRNVQYVSEDGNVAATNVLIRVDGEGNVVDGRAREIEALADFFAELNKAVIPNFLVNDADGLRAVCAYAAANPRFGDGAIVSGDTALLKSARESVPYLRRIYDASSETAFDGGALAAAANEGGATAIIVSNEVGTKSNVAYLQARAKCVWVRMDGTDSFAAFKGIASGAFGLITEGDPQAIAAAYGTFENSAKATLSRAPLDIAHRGLPFDYNENSLEGFAAAIDAGATHLEIDAQMTSDGKIVIMHDNDLARTTNGTGAISTMTLEQVRRYKIIKTYSEEVTGVESVIPTIDELFALCKEKDILLFFEIKTTNKRFAAEFKSKVEEYGMQKKIVVISFEESALLSIRTTTPYIWALSLSDRKPTVAETVTYYCEKDIGPDMSNGNLSYMRDLLERGFMPAAWTYAVKSSVKAAALEGVFAITNNDAAESASLPQEVVFGALPAVKKSELEKGDYKLTAQVKAYNGTLSDCECTLLSWRDLGDGAEAVFWANAGDWNYVTQTVRIDYAKESGCNSGIAFSALSLPFALAGCVALIVWKKARREEK